MSFFFITISLSAQHTVWHKAETQNNRWFYMYRMDKNKFQYRFYQLVESQDLLYRSES